MLDEFRQTKNALICLIGSAGLAPHRVGEEGCFGHQDSAPFVFLLATRQSCVFETYRRLSARHGLVLSVKLRPRSNRLCKSMKARTDGGVEASRYMKRNFKTGYKLTWKFTHATSDMDYRPHFLFNV